MKFYSKQNNGVVAVISEQHAKLAGIITKNGGDPLKAGVKVFTFIYRERYERDQFARLFFTGTIDDMLRLIELGGHVLVEGAGDTGWNGFVPFSNSEQFAPIRLPEDNEDRKATAIRNMTLRYVTNLTDVIEVFGAKAVTG